jgi:hypothetical protein
MSKIAGFARADHQINASSANRFKMLEGVALNAAAATRTLTLSPEGQYVKALILVDLSWTAAADVSITPSASLGDSTVTAPMTVAVTAGDGTITIVDRVDIKAVSADDQFLVEYDIRGMNTLSLVFAGTSGGASDTIDVYATLVAGE